VIHLIFSHLFDLSNLKSYGKMYIYLATKLGRITLCSKDSCCLQWLFSKRVA